ncbi:MAG: Maf family protein [Eubacteriales bacterium]
MNYILASGSPRRKEILHNLGLNFSLLCPDVDETSSAALPSALTESLALKKGAAAAEILRKHGNYTDDTVIISADTVVCFEGEILGKPQDKSDAKRMLRLLSGNTHSVVSGVALTCPRGAFAAHCETLVTFDTLDDRFIDFYVGSGEPLDKAGAYGIQGRAAAVIRGIDGCYFNVVGLPVNTLSHLARDNGIYLPF